MKELTDLTIKDLLSSNTSTNTLVINQNFAQVKESITLLQSTFGLQIQNSSLGTPNTRIFVGQVSADKIYLPNIGNVNNTGNAKIVFDGTNGNIIASGVSIVNDVYVGNDLIVGEKGKGGRLRLYTDRNTDVTKPPKLGEFKFTGPSFQGYVTQNEIPSTFSFSVLNTGSNGQTIQIKVNDSGLILVGSTSWSTDSIITSQNLVSNILTNGNQYITASYSSGLITIKSLPGLSSTLNGMSVIITGTVPTDVSSGTMLGGIDGTSRWITFGEGGSVGPTGATGPAYGSSGVDGTSGSSGASGTSGSSGLAGTNGTSGSSGVNGTSGSSGTSGADGAIGPRGYTGDTGLAGSSGTSGASGTGGTSGSSGTSLDLSTFSSFDVKLGDPSSTGYSWSSGFFNTWNNNYKVGQSLEDLDRIISLLAPPAPPSLSAEPLVLSSYYPAPYIGTVTINLGSSGAITSNTIITDSTSVNVQLANMSTAATSGGGFSKEPPKTLTAWVDGSSVGSHNYTDQSITPGSATYSQLQVVEYDYWNGVSGKSGFWPALTGKILNFFSGVSGSYGSHIAKFSWESGGSSITKTFWYDDPIAPTFSANNPQLDTTAGGTGTISGVPTLASGNTITVSAVIKNAVSKFYYSSPLVVASTTEIAISSVGTLSGAHIDAADVTIGATGTINSGIYNENLTLGATGYNAKGNSVYSSFNVSNLYTGRNMRADTISNESPRFYSGGTGGTGATAGFFPTSGYGTTYSTSTSLITGGYVYELQMLAGYYQRITGNYTSNYPVNGPNYTTDTNTGYRWATFKLPSVVSCNAFTISIPTTGTTWTGNGSNVTSGVQIFAKCDGISSSNWVDCNSPYPGVGQPGSGVTQGDAAMVVSSSTAIFKRVTFGTTSYSGDLFIRIGLPSGSTLKFGNPTIIKL